MSISVRLSGDGMRRGEKECLPMPRSGSAEKRPEARIAAKRPAFIMALAPGRVWESVRRRENLAW